ncbi:unnamed protein product [Lactuca saligna]|uniref:Uncharacterized protein n=1 Tax=Lactuca saligna TaxID=75948 RepID=A0AA36EKK4_LACSI|nr:unnamed protein product [Lactuca saligna]
MIEKLQADLATENALMDTLAIKTEKVQVVSTHLSHANTKIQELMPDKVVVKSVVIDVNKFLHNLIKTHDSMLTVSVRQHLVNKLQPIFYMLDLIDGVSKFGTLSKQCGEAKKVSGEEIKKPVGGSDEHE